MGKLRLSSAALLRFQAQLVAQLRSYNAQLRIQNPSLLPKSVDTASASVSVNFESPDRDSDDDDSVNQQAQTASDYSLTSAALRRIQAQIVAHLRACNLRLGLRAQVEAEQPCRLGAIAAVGLCAPEMSDRKSSGSHKFLESTSSNATEDHHRVSKNGGVPDACCSSKRRNNSLYSVDIRPGRAHPTLDFSRLKKRLRPFAPGDEHDERRGSERAYTASDGYSYVLDGRLSGQTNHGGLQDPSTKTDCKGNVFQPLLVE